MSSKLRITGPWPAWSPQVREGRMSGPEGQGRRVLLRILDHVPGDTESLAGLQAEAQTLASLRVPGLLRLVHVTSLKGKAALVYRFEEVVSIARVLDAQRARGGYLPVRICVEILHAVAQAVARTEQAAHSQAIEGFLAHRGPTPEDVLVDAQGKLRLAGLRIQTGPPSLPLLGYTPPEGCSSSSALAYGLGAFAVELFTGSRPAAGSTDAARHEQSVRAALAALRNRPGEPPPEALPQVIRLALHREPHTRPSSLALARQLSQLLARLRGPSLEGWATRAVPNVLKRPSAVERPQLEAGPPPQRRSLTPVPEQAEPTESEAPTVLLGQDLVERLRREALEDASEPTVEATGDAVEGTLEAVTPEAVPEQPRPRPTGLGPNPTLVADLEDFQSSPDPTLGAELQTDEMASTPVLAHEAEVAVGVAPLSGPAEPQVIMGAGPVEPPEEPDPEPPRKGSPALFLAIAAAAILAVGLGGVAWSVMGEDGPEQLEEQRIEEAPRLTETLAEVEEPDLEEELEPEPEPVEAEPAEPEPAEPEPAEPEVVEPEVEAPEPADAPAEAEQPEPEPATASVNPRLAPEPQDEDTGELRLDEEPADLEPSTPEPEPEPQATGGGYTVLFIPAREASNLTVKCHRGSASGSNPVRVDDAENGPCRVQAKGPSGSLVAFVQVDGPKTWTCFEGGSSECR